MARSTEDFNWWWRVGVLLVGTKARVLFRVRYLGVERIPTIGPAILAANHLSLLDGPLLALAPARFRRRACRFLVAAEFFEQPGIAFILRRFRQIPIRRGEGDEGALDEAVGTIRAGALAGIFPEGTVNPGTDLQRVRSGLARIALATGAPVIPVGIWGTQTRWSKSGIHANRPLRTRIALSFGEPLIPAGDPQSVADIQSFTERVMAALEKQIEAARAHVEGA